jgi:hypothetical protein
LYFYATLLIIFRRGSIAFQGYSKGSDGPKGREDVEDQEVVEEKP